MKNTFIVFILSDTYLNGCVNFLQCIIVIIHTCAYFIKQVLECFLKGLFINISFVVEFQKWWVLKSNIFWPRINIIKGFFFQIHWWLMVCHKVPKSYFQSQFSMSKINWIFPLLHLSVHQEDKYTNSTICNSTIYI